MTDRQFKAWLVWKREQLNEPSLTDFYLMQVAAEVARVLAKDPEKITVDRFKLKFGAPHRTQADAVAHSKSVWDAVTGVPLTPPPESSEPIAG